MVVVVYDDDEWGMMIRIDTNASLLWNNRVSNRIVVNDPARLGPLRLIMTVRRGQEPCKDVNNSTRVRRGARAGNHDHAIE